MEPSEVSIETVTPEMAMRWLAENSYEYQRNVRQSHVRFLAEEMQRGTFKQDTAIELTSVNGNTWLTDGQHRLTAVVSSGVPQRFVVVRRRADDASAVAYDYTRTDQVIVRSIAESYKILALETELCLSSSQVTALGRAVQLIDTKFNKVRRRMHPDDRLQMMREYNDAMDYYLEAIAGARRELRHKFDRSATLAVGLVTYKYSAKVYGREKVDEFWNGISQDDGLRLGDPRKAALRHLIEVGMIGGAKVTHSKITTPYFSSRWLASCFNAYIESKPLRFPRPNMDRPIEILGSPFSDK